MFRDHPQEIPLYLVWILRDFGIDKYKGRNTKGLLTAANFKKDAYYLYRSFLRPDEPLVHITSKTRFLRSGRADDGIKAYSNRAALTLYLNGVSQGELRNGAYYHRNGRSVDNVFHWRVSLREGRNDVRVVDGSGVEDTAVVYYRAPGSRAPAPAADDPIEDLRSSNPRSPAVLIAQQVQPQWPFYSEFDASADNTFDRLPPEVAGSFWITTPRVSKPENRTRISFRVRRGAEVFLMASEHVRVPPGLFVRLEPRGLWRDNEMRLVPWHLHRVTAQRDGVIRIPALPGDFVVLVKPR